MDFHLTHIIAIISVVAFGVVFAIRPQIRTYLFFVLYCFPVINLRITDDSLGGLTVFDLITIFSFLFFVRSFFELDQDSDYTYWLLFTLFFIVLFIGSLNSEFIGHSLLSAVKICPIFIYSRFFIIEFSKCEKFGFKCLLAMRRIYIFFLLFLLVQVCVGLDFTIYPDLASNVYLRDSGGLRYPGNFGDSQLHGQYLAMGSFILLFVDDRRKNIFLNYLPFFIALVAIILAGSRSAFGGFCMGAIFLIFAFRKFRIYGFLIGAFVLLYSWLIPVDGVFSRKQDFNNDYLFRESLWRDAIDISKEHPFFGIGLGNYKRYVEKHLPDQYIVVNEEFVFFDQPENGFLKIIVESGYLGFLLLFLFTILPVVKAILRVKRDDLDKSALFFIAGILSFLFAFSTVYSIWDHRILIFFTTLLLLCSHFPNRHTRISKIQSLD